MHQKHETPWLVAVWPGMGRIAQIAGSFLVSTLGPEPVAELPPEEFYELASIHARDGLLLQPSLPKGAFFRWKNPGAGRDLLVFIGASQPARHNLHYCDELLKLALEFDVSRVVTFAAMATPIRPEAKPRVFAVATSPELLAEARGCGAEPLREADISGLNGVLLAAAAGRELDGLCLLGEFPFFAGAIPNPKASAAVLSILARLTGIQLDLSPLEPQIREIERALNAHLLAFERAAGAGALAPPSDPGATDEAQSEGLNEDQRSYIESMFQAASRDRDKALELKAELDRLRVFEEFEDRFLDLFKQAD